MVQALAEADGVGANALAAVLHAAARLSATSGAQSSNGTHGWAAGSSGFHAAQGAHMQAFQRSLDWPQQQTRSSDCAFSAVRSSPSYSSSSSHVCRLSLSPVGVRAAWEYTAESTTLVIKDVEKQSDIAFAMQVHRLPSTDPR